MAPDFSDVYEEHVWHVYGFIAYRVRSREEAEDLTQLTFERALRAWGRYDPQRSQPATWLLAIARNIVIDRYRANAGHPPGEPLHETLESRLPSAQDAPWLGLDPRLAAALEGLDSRAQEVLALRFGGDLNGPEIAELMGLSLANVQQILSRSLRRLRSDLESADDQQDEAER